MKSKKSVSAVMIVLVAFFVLQMPANSASRSSKVIDKPAISHHTSSSLKCSGDKAAKSSKVAKDSKCGSGKCGNDKSAKVDKSAKTSTKSAKCGGDKAAKVNKSAKTSTKSAKCGGDKSAKSDKSAKKTNKAEKCGVGKCG